MAAVLMTGSIKDFSFTSMTDYNVRIGFFPSGTSTRGEFLFPTMPKWVEPDQLGSFSIRLESTAGLVPQVWYAVKFEWMDKAGNFISMDTPDWVLVVPAGGGTVAANIAQVKPDRIITKGDPGDSSPQTIAAAKEAARQAIDEANLLRQDDPRVPFLGGNYHGDEQAYLGGTVDSNFRQTWLGARASDGGPTDWAMTHLQRRLGVHLLDDPEYVAGFTDSAFRYTELVARRTDGAVPDWVMDRWAPRIAERIGGGGSGAGFSIADQMLDSSGNLVPVMPDMDVIYGLGSSSMAGIGSALANALSDTGATFYGEGKSGERSEEIFARLGSRPALLTVAGGAIPASGPVSVTASNMPTTSYLKGFNGTLAGIRGSLSSNGTALTFLRSSDGTATAVPAGTPFIPDMAAGARKSVVLLWAGKNNMTTAGASGQVIQQTDAAFNWLTPIVKRALVLGHFIDSTQAVGSIQYQNVIATNDAHRARYGDLFVDINAYLSSARLWQDTGITPTATDLQQQSSGVKPDSVSSDAAHLNAAGYTAVARFIRTHLARLGWY